MRISIVTLETKVAGRLWPCNPLDIIQKWGGTSSRSYSAYFRCGATCHNCRTPRWEIHGTFAPRGKQGKQFFLEQLSPSETFHYHISQLKNQPPTPFLSLQPFLLNLLFIPSCTLLSHFSPPSITGVGFSSCLSYSLGYLINVPGFSYILHL